MPTKPPTTNHQLYHFTISLLASLALLFFLAFALHLPDTSSTAYTLYAIALLHAVISHVIYNSN